MLFLGRFFSISTCHSTKTWMAKHVSDPYVRRSVKENYRARSAFKLIEMNDTYKFIEPGHVVIDMGAAPGAWSQVLVKHVNARISPGKKIRKDPENELVHPSEITSFHQPNPDLKCGTVIALDRDPIFEIPGVHIIDDWNLTEETTSDCNKRLKDLLTRLKVDKVDGILSDMCPNLTGCKAIDHAAIVTLQQHAFDFARRLLKPNGYFLCKLFQGQDSFQEMRSLLQSLFHTVHLVKPSSSRSESSEMYLLALQYHEDTSTKTDKKDVNEMERLLAEARRIFEMALKRKTRNLPTMNDVSFFDPVYPNDDIQMSDNDENDLLADGIPRPSFERGNQNESTETLGTETITNHDEDLSSELISTSKIIGRIKQIQNSIQQAQTMLESIEEFKHLPGTEEQRQKLYSIISNLEEQHTSYVNLLNLISLTDEERSAVLNRNYEEEDDLSLRRNIQSPFRPRIESKIGFIPSATISTVPPLINSSDNEQTTRNEYSNYDSLVGSLKSDTITWKDQQSTSEDETSDVEMEKKLMLHKEQFRALQGQKRALSALQRRSEQQLTTEKSSNLTETNEEDGLLFDINNLRDRLKVLRNIYEQKHQVELQRLQKSPIPTENRLKNLEHVRERLDELEQLVTYYQTDYEDETSIPSPDPQDNTPKHLDKLSSDLTAKRLELEQAKSALNQLQQMVKTIQPEGDSSSARSTPTSRKSPSKNNEFDSTPNSVDAKMVAQHREIERLVESRQRLHTIKDQIVSLHQSMTTPITQSKNDLSQTTQTYEEKLNDSRNIRPTYRQESTSPSELDEDISSPIHIPPRMKQSNLYASDTIVGKSSEDLNTQMREICRCLSTFIEEQKSFNRHIEQRLTTVTNPSASQSTDPIFNQLQQQVLTQGLIVNLNTAYREIAVLQSEINVLQSENNRLASSISFDNHYHHSNMFDHNKAKIRPQSHSRSENSSKTSLSSSKENLSTDFVIRRRPITTDNFSPTVLNIRSTISTQDLDQATLQTLDLQVKSIMVQLIPFMRLHINEIFNQSILHHIRERIVFLFKQQPDSARLIRHFRNQFSELLEKTIEKYCGTTIRECAADLIRDISDLSFDELVKYKIYENTNPDEEESKDSDFEPANPLSTELKSNGHEYILVNRSINNHIVPKTEEENEN